MSVLVLNLDIDSGCHYYLNTIYTDNTTNLPRDITNYHATLEVRSEWDSPTILLTKSDGAGSILMGGPLGTITVAFLPGDTDPNQQTPTFWTRGVYDLVITDSNGIKIKLLKGFVNIIGSVSI